LFSITKDSSTTLLSPLSFGSSGNRRDLLLAAGAARKFRRAVVREDDCVCR